jgi:hypothetical protein
MKLWTALGIHEYSVLNVTVNPIGASERINIELAILDTLCTELDLYKIVDAS